MNSHKSQKKYYNVLMDMYKRVRQESLNMVKPLNTEDYIPQAARFASPPKWNLGHTSWFFEEMILSKYVKDYQPFHPKYSYLFNSYYNTVGERILRHDRGNLSRPTVDEVLDYRKHVDKHMHGLLSNENLEKPIRDLAVLGINHEQQHQELFFTDLKYTFSVNPLYPAYSEVAFCEDKNSGESGFISINEGVYEIGFSGNGFCFDNELSRHRVFLEAYEIQNNLVTNGDFINFIDDGGYGRFELWHDDALAWKEENQISHPMYWQKIDGDWYQYTLAGLRKIQPEHILTHINYYEAFAFAQWKGLRLPTEFEWEAAADKFDWGKRWEWTESAYMPYPGYKKASGAVGEYNGKFMVNQKVLRGASVVTAETHSRKTYRNFFHPQVGYQFNGIRLARG
jgi:ergothioneine biosynthesis protein EgtB